MKNPYRLWLVAALAAAAAPAYAGAQTPAAPPAAARPVRVHPLERLVEQRAELKLTDAQVAQIRQQHEALRPTMEQLRQNQRTAMQQVRDLLTEEQRTLLRERMRDRMSEQRRRRGRNPGARPGRRPASGEQRPDRE